MKFTSEWIEKCVRQILQKPDGVLTKEDMNQIRYLRAGGDFGGELMLEMSTQMPPDPFVAHDGGDEWIYSLYGEDSVGSRYDLEKQIQWFGKEICLDHFHMECWEYAMDAKGMKEWKAFQQSVHRSYSHENYSAEQLCKMGRENLLPVQDICQFAGLKVLRLSEMELEDCTFFQAFQDLKVLELAEVSFGEKKGVEEFARLKQVSFWMD